MREFQFVGFATMNDPLRENVAETVRRLLEANMQVVMLTGDDRIPTMDCAIGTKIIVDPEKEYFKLRSEYPTLSKD